jgi:hypothetical protein
MANEISSATATENQIRRSDTIQLEPMEKAGALYTGWTIEH